MGFTADVAGSPRGRERTWVLRLSNTVKELTMIGSDKARRRWATRAVGVAMTVSVGLAAWQVAAVGFAAEGAKAPAPAALDAPILDESHVRHVYATAEEWVRSGRSPVDVAPLRVTGVTGVRATLRWMGMSVGVGQVTTQAIPTSEKGSADLALATQIAVNQALDAFEQTLAKRREQWEAERVKGLDEAVKGAVPSTQPDRNAPVANPHAGPRPDAMSLKTVAPNLRLDLQVAGPLEAIRIDEKAAPDALFSQFAPGYHALRMTRPKGNSLSDAWVWPATALAANTMPTTQVRSMLSALEFDINKDFQRIGRPNGPALQRAVVIHIARSSGTEAGMTKDASAAEVLVRGSVLLPPVPIEEKTLDSLSRTYAAFLARRMKNEVTIEDPREKGKLKPRQISVIRMAGTYLPSSGVYETLSASDDEIALTTYALARWAKSLDGLSAFVDDKGHSRLPVDLLDLKLEVESALRNNLETILSGPIQDGTASPSVLAYSLLTLLESPRMADRKMQRDDIARNLFGLIQEDGAMQGKIAKDKNRVEPVAVGAASHAMITFALAGWYQQTRDGANLPALLRASRWGWAHPATRSSPEALMWMINAELVMRKALAGVTDADGKPPQTGVSDKMILAAAHSFRETQIVRAPEGPGAGPADVVGGFVTMRMALETSAEAPDWRSATFVYFLAATLRDPKLGEPKDRLATLLAAGLGARFIQQLTFDPKGGYYVRSPEDTLGGVRVSLWDNRLPASSTAMALLAFTELREAIASIKANQEIK